MGKDSHYFIERLPIRAPEYSHQGSTRNKRIIGEFEEVDPPEVPYTQKRAAHYNDKFSFKPPPHVLIQKSIKLEDQMKEQVKSVESKVLTVFTTFMGAFVSSLVLIVVDFQSVSDKLPGVKELVILNYSPKM